MSESLFLINPRRRKRRRNPRKGRMPAGLARYWAARRGGRKRRKARAVMTNPRRRNPRRSHRARRRNPLFARRRRRNPVARHVSRRRRRHNPIHRHRRRARHRNPFSTGSLKSVLVPAAYGAGGAIAMNVLYGYLSPSLPATLTTGYLPTLVKAAAAIGVGMLIGKFMSRQDGQYATVGGLTVVLLGAVTPLLQSAAPTLPGLSGLAGMGDYIPYSRPGMGAYIRNPGVAGLGRLGFLNPAGVIGAGGRANPMGAYMTRPVPGMADLTGSGYNYMSDGM